MSGTTWTGDEIAALSLPWSEFSAQFPDRSQSAYQHKRLDVSRNHARRPESKDASSGSSFSSPSVGPKAASVVPSFPPEGITDAELFDAVVAYQDAIGRAQPHVLEKDVQVRADQSIAVAFLSDWHIGSQGTDLRRIREDVELIARHPRLYAALGGDPIDNFILDKMGSAARSQSAQVDTQWRLFRYLVNLLHESGSLLWVSSGNHDAWTEKVAGIDGIVAALRGIPVVYTGEGALVRLTVGQQLYRIYRKHKPTGFSSRAAQTYFTRMMLARETPWEFDIGVSEHLHQMEIAVWEYRRLDRIAIACGSYKVVDPYAEGLGYYGGGYGVPTVLLSPHHREMLALPSIHHAINAIDALDGIRPLAAA